MTTVLISNNAICFYRKFLIRNIYKYLIQYRLLKYKHAPCHSFNYFESWYTSNWCVLMSHATKYLQYYNVQSQRTHRNNTRLSRFTWITYAKSQGKTCYIAGVHNTGPTGQMWPSRGLKMARKRFTECSQCFKVNWSTFSRNCQLTTWCSSKGSLHLWIKLRLRTWPWKIRKNVWRSSLKIFKTLSRS